MIVAKEPLKKEKQRLAPIFTGSFLNAVVQIWGEGGIVIERLETISAFRHCRRHHYRNAFAKGYNDNNC
jgi:hypothetical protein